MKASDKNFYTYVVDHGDESPAIGADTVINGGKVQAVMFEDALMKLEVLENFVATWRDLTDCDATRQAIDDLTI
jgi:hypothetical protein